MPNIDVNSKLASWGVIQNPKRVDKIANAINKLEKDYGITLEVTPPKPARAELKMLDPYKQQLVEIKRDDTLVDTTTKGDTPLVAVERLLNKINGQHLVYDACSRGAGREEFKVAKNLFTVA